MYDAPIKLCEMINTAFEEQREKHIVNAIQKVGVYVDKEELIRALEYDRDQYSKGYSDGSAVIREIREEIEKIYEEKKEIDSQWAAGLRYAVKTIDRHT